MCMMAADNINLGVAIGLGTLDPNHKDAWRSNGDTMGGFWYPHSSSVDFCEPNYHLTHYLVEPHNAFSSLFISLVGLLGIIYSNPLNEWPFTMLFAQLIVIGIGSFALHGSLHWLFQSCDEIPMMWFTLWAIYTQNGLKSGPNAYKFGKWTLLFTLLNILITIMYFTFQEYYGVFLTGYILATVVLVVWNTLIVREKYFWILNMCYIATGFFFLWLGVGVWIIDMNYCHDLLQYYKKMGGWTIHVVWHLSSGLGGYFQTLTLISARAHRLGRKVRVQWKFFIMPCLVIDAAREKDNLQKKIVEVVDDLKDTSKSNQPHEPSANEGMKGRRRAGRGAVSS